MDVSEWAERVSQERVRMYVGHYPKSVARIMGRLIG